LHFEMPLFITTG